MDAGVKNETVPKSLGLSCHTGLSRFRGESAPLTMENHAAGHFRPKTRQSTAKWRSGTKNITSNTSTIGAEKPNWTHAQVSGGCGPSSLMLISHDLAKKLFFKRVDVKTELGSYLRWKPIDIDLCKYESYLKRYDDSSQVQGYDPRLLIRLELTPQLRSSVLRLTLFFEVKSSAIAFTLLQQVRVG